MRYLIPTILFLIPMLSIAGQAPIAQGFDNKNVFQAIIPNSSQKVNVTASSLQSTAFAASTNLIRIFSTKDAYVKCALNPTATTSDMFLPGGIVEYIGVTPGHKCAVIRDSVDGVLHITEGK